MDEAYNQHASHHRRTKNRSTNNLSHLTLAPLTSRLPIDDLASEDYPLDPLSAPPSYLQGKSAPTTPRLLSRSPGQPRKEKAVLPKSKSTTHLQQKQSGKEKKGNGRRKRSTRESGTGTDEPASDTDWLLRAGALISTETRESKGQAWLVSRASSTSLAGSEADRQEEEAVEREFTTSRHASRHASRRGSLAGLSVGFVDELTQSPAASRLGSRSHSRVGSRGGGLLTPSRSVDGYFTHHNHGGHHQYHHQEEGDDGSFVAGPDFVNLDERLELSAAGGGDTSHEDEAHVRRLVKNGGAGAGTWFGNVLGWGLFSVEENEDEEEGGSDEGEGDADDDGDDGQAADDDDLSSERRGNRRSTVDFRVPDDERVAPPNADEGGWQDAAWLLSVATKVLL